MAANYLLTRFGCGHVGRDNETTLRQKARAFIRVGEVRQAPVEHVGKNCPDCK